METEETEVTEEIVTEEPAVEPEVDEEGNPIEPVVEPWMEEETEDQTSDDDPSQSVPVGKFVGLKKKLRGQITERDDEIEKLKRENAELAKLKPKPETALARPKRDDFDDDELFDEAFDEYTQSRTAETINRTRLEEQKQTDQQKAHQNLTEAVDSHYLRAAELIEKRGIKPEIYQAADTTVRKAVEAIFPNQGDIIVDQIISVLGEGSEKVIPFIGRNKAALAKLQSLLVSDKSGMKAAVYLGEEKRRLLNITNLNPRSNAPNPATGIKGDAPAAGAAGRFKKKFDAADAKDNIQLAYDIKKEARAAGVDVSKWT